MRFTITAIGLRGLGFAWGVGGRSGPPKVVIRGGSGIFYDRFQITPLLQAQHLNGVSAGRIRHQQPHVLSGPRCTAHRLRSRVAALQLRHRRRFTRSDPRLHAPYTIQSAVSVERQVTKAATVSVTYLNSRGFDQFVTINANAAFPGTPCYPNCPIPAQNIYRYVSEGNFKQNQLIANTNVRIGAKVQVFGYYTLNYANSDTSGVSSFATNSYNISQDYGRASFDIAASSFSRRQRGAALFASPESVHDREFRIAVQHLFTL